MPVTYNIPPSRLTTSTVGLRATLEARNLYTPNSEYPLQSSTNTAKVVSTINTIIGGLTPFKSYNLENTAYGRIIEGNTNTPLATIGLAMLGKQMALNMMSNTSQQLLPVIKVSNLFDGDPSTNLFTSHKNFSITKIATQSNFSNFIRTIVGTKNPSQNPFSELSTNSTYLSNTGSGQLVFMLDQLNKNIYKSADTNLNQIASEVKDPIQSRTNLISIGNKSYFNFTDSEFYPYLKHYPSATSNYDADESMINSVNNAGTKSQEYAPNRDYIDNLGQTHRLSNEKISLTSTDDRNMWIGKTEFVNDNIQKIIWGRDGISKSDIAYTKLSELRGNFNGPAAIGYSDFNDTYNIKYGGLLEYTRNLVRATEGQIGDITRKAFKNGDEIIGFNGSGLWQSNESNYIKNSMFTGKTGNKTGIRQHTALDPYDRFAKAIRFDGNALYGGSENSVIYNSVMPRIHPTMLNGVLNNKNLMFSIENLAVRVINSSADGSGTGIIDDEFGSEIPACEVGPFNGRMMWFPPYNVELNETATAKYEPTVMIGRNEPMYNYQNSERSATLNFTLLIDYPPQVRNYMTSDTPQKDIAEFFAFGGDKLYDESYVTNLEEKKQILIDQKVKFEGGRQKLNLIEKRIPNRLYVYFPNDVPKEADVNGCIDDMYNSQYDVAKNVITTTDDTFYGLNQPIYFSTGLTKSYDAARAMFVYKVPEQRYSQYSATGVTDQFGTCELNKALHDVFDDEIYRKYYEIEIMGSASTLFTDKYNYYLGMRRASAAKTLVDFRLRNMYKKTPEEMGINFILSSKGEKGSNISGDTKAGISLEEVKRDRFAVIRIKRNLLPFDENVGSLTQTESDLVLSLNTSISNVESKINAIKSAANSPDTAANCVMKEKLYDDTAILHGFESISKNYYQPVFHSQTPEDFHKRLTFLQQCTRQGAATHYYTDANNITSKNSVFGRQPICILRYGDFLYTKVIIESINFDYVDAPWDMNPEGFGMQPMLAKITLTMKIIGGQSLKGPIDALQNAVSFNYYANSTFTDKGMYTLPFGMGEKQASYKKDILIAEQTTLRNQYNDFINKTKETNSKK